MTTYLTDSDFIVYEENGKIKSGGYDVDSFLLREGISPIQTLNSENQKGGEKVSSPFENLSVPAGIFYIHTKVNKNLLDPLNQFDLKDCNYNSQHIMLSDEIHDKLFQLIEVDKKKKRKTKKNIHNLKKNNKFTRKQ